MHPVSSLPGSIVCVIFTIVIGMASNIKCEDVIMAIVALLCFVLYTAE